MEKQDQVEQLARALYEEQAIGGREIPWLDVGAGVRRDYRTLAQRLVERGVTLAPPARVSPVQAAEKALRDWLKEFGGKYPGVEYHSEGARAVLAAAVGALTTAQINKLGLDIRAALLAALTEGGEG